MALVSPLFLASVASLTLAMTTIDATIKLLQQMKILLWHMQQLLLITPAGNLANMYSYRCTTEIVPMALIIYICYGK